MLLNATLRHHLGFHASHPRVVNDILQLYIDDIVYGVNDEESAVCTRCMLCLRTFLRVDCSTFESLPCLSKNGSTKQKDFQLLTLWSSSVVMLMKLMPSQCSEMLALPVQDNRKFTGMSHLMNLCSASVT